MDVARASHCDQASVQQAQQSERAAIERGQHRHQQQEPKPQALHTPSWRCIRTSCQCTVPLNQVRIRVVRSPSFRRNLRSCPRLRAIEFLSASLVRRQKPSLGQTSQPKLRSAGIETTSGTLCPFEPDKDIRQFVSENSRVAGPSRRSNWRGTCQRS